MADVKKIATRESYGNALVEDVYKRQVESGAKLLKKLFSVHLLPPDIQCPF